MPPSDCIQHYVDPWWIDDKSPEVRRGRLLKTLVPYPEQNPYTLTPEGRSEDQKDHKKALFKIEPYRLASSAKPRTLPVAALPLWAGERFLVSRGKLRPVLVISTCATAPTKDVSQGMATYQTSPTLLVAPYFGADKDGTRGGVPEELLGRIRRAEYPQYMWDSLPLANVKESYLRMDQVFPMGSNQAGYERTDYALSSDALAIVDEWFSWLISGEAVPPDSSTLGYLRTELLGMG